MGAGKADLCGTRGLIWGQVPSSLCKSKGVRELRVCLCGVPPGHTGGRSVLPSLRLYPWGHWHVWDILHWKEEAARQRPEMLANTLQGPRAAHCITGPWSPRPMLRLGSPDPGDVLIWSQGWVAPRMRPDTPPAGGTHPHPCSGAPWICTFRHHLTLHSASCGTCRAPASARLGGGSTHWVPVRTSSISTHLAVGPELREVGPSISETLWACRFPSADLGRLSNRLGHRSPHGHWG